MGEFHNIPIWFLWVLPGVILLIIEIFTPGFVVSLIGISCILAGVSSLFYPNFIFNVIVFSVSLILLLVFIRPLFLKFFVKEHKNIPETFIDSIIGKEFLVDSDIDNLKGLGYIKVGADYFKARSDNGDPITKGEVVKVLKMDGITVTVRKK